MRVIGEIPHDKMRITIFYMNQKYILKFEMGHLEQNYKISEIDYGITTLDEVKKIANESFLNAVEGNFHVMNQLLNKHIEG